MDGPLPTVEQTVSGCAIDDRLADKLEAKTGSPGLKILRHYRDGARVVVLATRSVYPADRYSLTTTLVRTKEAPRKE